MGGETPIILSHEVARYFKLKHRKFYDQCKAHGVQYVRVMPEDDDNDSPIGRSCGGGGDGAAAADDDDEGGIEGGSRRRDCWLSQRGVATD